MKNFLTLLLLAGAFALHAQDIPGRPPIKVLTQWQDEYPKPAATRDSNFVFDKFYYQQENHWVTWPKGRSYRGYGGQYVLGFIYFDAVFGYTIFEQGLFNVNAKGRAFIDTIKTSRPPYPAKWPFRIQLLNNSNAVATLPDNMLNDLQLKKTPGWLLAYRQNHPDTVQPLAKRIRYGHLYGIYAKDASKHVGEYVDVKGMIYGDTVKIDRDKPGSKMALLYMGGGNYPNQKLTIIIRDIGNQGEDRPFLKALNTQPRQLTENNLNSAKGTIFIYEGKPAVEIKHMELGMISFVDMTPTAAQLENYR